MEAAGESERESEGEGKPVCVEPCILGKSGMSSIAVLTHVCARVHSMYRRMYVRTRAHTQSGRVGGCVRHVGADRHLKDL
jgi:hypothetical protein